MLCILDMIKNTRSIQEKKYSDNVVVPFISFRERRLPVQGTRRKLNDFFFHLKYLQTLFYLHSSNKFFKEKN